MSKVTVTVLQEGDQLPPEYISPRPAEGQCWRFVRTHRSTWEILPSHTWTPVQIGEASSTWYCSVCRQVERRSVEG